MKILNIHNFVILIGAYLLMNSAVFAEEELNKRFFAEAPKAWGTLINFQNNLEGTYNKELISLLSGKYKLSKVTGLKYRVDGQYKCNNGNKYLRYKLTNWIGISYETIFCCNAKYGFILDRKSSNDPWIVSALEEHKSSVLERLERQGAILHLSCTIDGQSLLWIVRQPGFLLKDIRVFETNGKELVEIAFETSNFLFDDDKTLGGRVVLDPKNFWAVKYYKVQKLWDVKEFIKGYVEYAGKLDGYPMPKSCVMEYEDRSKLTITFQNIRKCDAPDSDFSLSAFGLSEKLQEK
jgi:hypothetical protein